MADTLNTCEQIAAIGALAERSSNRSIERITGIHLDTIMRRGVKVGQGCAALLDAKMRHRIAAICRLMRFGASSARRENMSQLIWSVDELIEAAA